MPMKLLLSIASACLISAGCSRQLPVEAPVGMATRQPMEPRAPAVQSGKLPLPAALRFPAVDAVRESDSWQERLMLLTHSERERLEAINLRYYGMLEFNSKEEQGKLVAAGFPMPEEWLAADAMSDVELARLAKANSPKGALFYADRQFDRFVDSKQQLLSEGRYSDLDPSVFNPKVEAMVYAANALALTRSPFAAYLYGSVHTTMFGDMESTAAAISVARALGDPRARQLANDYAQRVRSGVLPPLEFSALSSIEASMWREVHRYRPL